MAVFQGEPVVIGDRLHIFNEGQAFVSDLYTNGLAVRIPNKGTRNYSYEGVRQGDTAVSLFWHDPVIVYPPKNYEAWRRQRKTHLAVAEAIEGFSVREISEESIADGTILLSG